MDEECWNVSVSVCAVFQHIQQCVVIVKVVVHYDDHNGSGFFCVYCFRQK